MSILAAWCTVSGVLFCYSAVYVWANSRQLRELGEANSRDKKISLPKSVMGQLAVRGVLFVLGSIFFAVVMGLVFVVVGIFARPAFRDLELALLLSSWLGGLFCATFTQASAKICYWTAQVLRDISIGI